MSAQSGSGPAESGAAGCTQGFYKKWADKQVFGIIGSKKQIVAGAGDDTLMSITPPQPVKLEALVKKSETADFLVTGRSLRKAPVW